MGNSKQQTIQGQCPCGATTFTVSQAPVMRSYCHCEFCQDFNQAPFADICVVSAKKVTLADDSKVKYQSYSPTVQRGKCPECDKPAIEFINLPGLGRWMSIIPSSNLPESVTPAPSCHGFYHRRREDAADNLPKYSGLWRSHLGFGKHFVAGLLGRGR